MGLAHTSTCPLVSVPGQEELFSLCYGPLSKPLKSFFKVNLIPAIVAFATSWNDDVAEEFGDCCPLGISIQILLVCSVFFEHFPFFNTAFFPPYPCGSWDKLATLCNSMYCVCWLFPWSLPFWQNSPVQRAFLPCLRKGTCLFPHHLFNNPQCCTLFERLRHATGNPVGSSLKCIFVCDPFKSGLN